MKTIIINGVRVKVSAETFRRVVKIAAAKKLPLPEAVSFCLEKVI